MAKEKEIWLNPEEIKQLLEGGLYWNDIEEKLSPENADSFRRHMEKDEDLEIDQIIKEATVKRHMPQENLLSEPPEPAESAESAAEEDVRSILLGEGNNQAKSIVKDRQINVTHLQEMQLAEDHAIQEEKLPLPQLSEEDEQEVGIDEKNSFSDQTPEEDLEETKVLWNGATSGNKASDNELKEMMLSNEIEIEQEERGFGGLKLVLLMMVAAAITFGSWYYFVTR